MGQFREKWDSRVGDVGQWGRSGTQFKKIIVLANGCSRSKFVLKTIIPFVLDVVPQRTGGGNIAFN